MDSTACPFRTAPRVRRAIGLWLVVVLQCVAQPSEVAGTMPEDYFPSLRLILAQAARQSPTILAKNLELAQVEANRHRAAAALYPLVDARASYNASSSSVAEAGKDSTSSSSGLFYGVNLSQNLFQFGAVKAGADIVSIAEKVAKAQYGQAYVALAGTIRFQYLNLVLRKAALRTTKVRLDYQEQDYQTKLVRIEQGEVARSERGGLEIERERARLLADRQADEFDAARRVLIRIAGLAELPDEAISDEVPSPRDLGGVSAGLVAAFLAGGVEKTTQAQVLAYGVRQSQLGITVARSGTLPRFSIGGGVGLNNSTSVDGVGRLSQAAVQSQNYAVSLSWTLWDSGATKWNTRSALASKSAAERALRTYVETNRDEAELKAKAVGLAFREMSLSERDRASSLNSLELERQHLELGTVPRVAVERAIVAYNSAELAAWTARVAFLQQWTEFVALVDADPIKENLPTSLLNHGQ